MGLMQRWDPEDQVASDYQWWFQSFTRSGIRSYNGAELNVIRGMLRKLPKKDSSEVHFRSLGYSRAGQNDLNYPISLVTGRVKPMNLKNWLTTTAKSYFLDGVDDALVEELITNSNQF